MTRFVVILFGLLISLMVPAAACECAFGTHVTSTPFCLCACEPTFSPPTCFYKDTEKQVVYFSINATLAKNFTGPSAFSSGLLISQLRAFYSVPIAEFEKDVVFRFLEVPSELFPEMISPSILLRSTKVIPILDAFYKTTPRPKWFGDLGIIAVAVTVPLLPEELAFGQSVVIADGGTFVVSLNTIGWVLGALFVTVFMLVTDGVLLKVNQTPKPPEPEDTDLYVSDFELLRRKTLTEAQRRRASIAMPRRGSQVDNAVEADGGEGGGLLAANGDVDPAVRYAVSADGCSPDAESAAHSGAGVDGGEAWPADGAADLFSQSLPPTSPRPPEDTAMDSTIHDADLAGAAEKPLTSIGDDAHPGAVGARASDVDDGGEVGGQEGGIYSPEKRKFSGPIPDALCPYPYRGGKAREEARIASPVMLDDRWTTSPPDQGDAMDI